MNKINNYEESVKRLEVIIKQLEEGELPLEKSIDLFTEGMELVKTCNQYLEHAEEKIKILVGDKVDDFNLTSED
ncbi:MAG: exodeoxyribonuclease VII small subunit [Peptococcales bacterium]|jgi:exodeoxyribonuclease VII small subunit